MELVVVKSAEPFTGDKMPEVQFLWPSHIFREFHKNWQTIRVNEGRSF
jgi:hypothetical protein